MNRRHLPSLRAAAGLGTVTLLLAGSAAPGLAAPKSAADDSDVEVTDTETVQVYTDASGEVDTQRIYEQLVLTGDGDVSLENPVSTDGLRNLDGFSGYDVEDGAQIIETSVDGQERVRSVSDYGGDLPLDLSITYLLDGEEVEPGDVVGQSGDLEVRYHVENVTAETRSVDVADGQGGTVSRDVEVVLPMVGSLSTVLPSSFTDVQSEQANIAGDGRGGTKMSFTMTLFPPIGSPEVEFGYTATISDGVIPDATISALPVNPLESASFKTAGKSYQGGADTGAELTAGATEIDASLLKLRDGASDLTVGLLKLYDGAGQLSAGLNQDAVPGTQKLAAGSSDLSDGATRLYVGSGDLVEGMVKLQGGTVQLSDGAGDLKEGAVRLRGGATELNDGAIRLRDGATDLNDGAARLDNGAGQIDDGANQLADGLLLAGQRAPELIGGLRQVRAGLKLVDGGLTQLYGQVGGARAQFRGGIDQLIAGIGTTGNPQTLLGGLVAIRTGLQGAVTQLSPAIDGELPCAIALLHELSAGTPAPAACLPAGAPAPGQVGNPLQQVYLANLRDGSSSLLVGLTELRGGLTDPQLGAIAGLTRVVCGLSNTADPVCPAAQPGILQGIETLDAGITQLIDGIQGGIGSPNDTPAEQTLRGGVNGLQSGVGLLIGGGDDLLAGLQRLTQGSVDLATGTGDLVDGTGQLVTGSRKLADGTVVLSDGTKLLTDGTIDLAEGTERLADGANDLNDGAGELKDGSVQLNDGADQLADGSDQLEGGLFRLLEGLMGAADGSNQLRDGLRTASKGAPKIEKGATKLSKKGTTKLIEAGSETAITFGENYAVLQQGAERAQQESMAFGAPEGAQGLMAYTYEIRGEDGEGGRSLGRGLAALGLFAAGTGFVMFRRRLG